MNINGFDVGIILAFVIVPLVLVSVEPDKTEVKYQFVRFLRLFIGGLLLVIGIGYIIARQNAMPPVPETLLDGTDFVLGLTLYLVSVCIILIVLVPIGVVLLWPLIGTFVGMLPSNLLLRTAGVVIWVFFVISMHFIWIGSAVQLMSIKRRVAMAVGVISGLLVIPAIFLYAANHLPLTTLDLCLGSTMETSMRSAVFGTEPSAIFGMTDAPVDICTSEPLWPSATSRNPIKLTAAIARVKVLAETANTALELKSQQTNEAYLLAQNVVSNSNCGSLDLSCWGSHGDENRIAWSPWFSHISEYVFIWLARLITIGVIVVSALWIILAYLTASFS